MNWKLFFYNGNYVLKNQIKIQKISKRIWIQRQKHFYQIGQISFDSSLLNQNSGILILYNSNKSWFLSIFDEYKVENNNFHFYDRQHRKWIQLKFFRFQFPFLRRPFKVEDISQIEILFQKLYPKYSEAIKLWETYKNEERISCYQANKFLFPNKNYLFYEKEVDTDLINLAKLSISYYFLNANCHYFEPNSNNFIFNIKKEPSENYTINQLLSIINEQNYYLSFSPRQVTLFILKLRNLVKKKFPDEHLPIYIIEPELGLNKEILEKEALMYNESSFFRDPLMELCIASRTKITTIDKYLTRLVFKEIIPYVGITNFEKLLTSSFNEFPIIYPIVNNIKPIKSDSVQKFFENLSNAEKIERTIFKDIVITIDNNISHIKDDGFSLRYSEEGDPIIGIHVADPTSYIPPNTEFDETARSRAFNWYNLSNYDLLPMFPRSMQEIFSLNNNKEVRALSFEVKLNNDGSIMDYNIFLSTLTNIQNFTLHSIQNTDINEINTIYKFLSYIAETRQNYRKKQNSKIVYYQTSIPEIVIWEMNLIAAEVGAMFAKKYNIPVPFTNDLHSYSTEPQLYVRLNAPLRRYLDLLSHYQIKAILLNEPLPFNKIEIEEFIYYIQQIMSTMASIEQKTHLYNVIQQLSIGKRYPCIIEKVFSSKNSLKNGAIVKLLGCKLFVKIPKNLTVGDIILLIPTKINALSGILLLKCEPYHTSIKK